VCYQIGVFISRSSLTILRIRKIWLLTAFQAFNFMILLVNAKTMYVENLYVLCPIYFWVGLMGGGSYVNVVHGLLEKQDLAMDEKESAISLSLMFNDLGILLASILSLLLDNLYFDFK